MRLLHTNILVKLMDKTQKKNGLVLIGEEHNSLNFGEILSIGGAIDNDSLNIGKIVVFPKLIARKFKDNLAIIDISDIILVYDTLQEYQKDFA